MLRYHLLPRHDDVAFGLEPHHSTFLAVVSRSHLRPLESAASGAPALRERRPIPLHALCHACLFGRPCGGGRCVKDRDLCGVQRARLEPGEPLRDGAVRIVKLIGERRRYFAQRVSKFREHRADTNAIRNAAVTRDGTRRVRQIWKRVSSVFGADYGTERSERGRQVLLVGGARGREPCDRERIAADAIASIGARGIR